MKFVYDDGGREKAGYKGKAGDCVCRAIAIATERPYTDVYRDLKAFSLIERVSPKYTGKRKSNPRTGVKRPTIRKYLAAIGWKWIPTMSIGSGCKVHLHDGELPNGRLIVSVSKHLTAVIDGVIHDTFNPQRESVWIDGHGNSGISRRCVYGYWVKEV